MQLNVVLSFYLFYILTMYIEIVPNRDSPPCVLLREAWRENAKIKKRTVANLSELDPHVVEGLRLLLKGGVAVEKAGDAMEIRRSLGHGHVAIVLHMMKKLQLEKLLAPVKCRERDLVMAMIAARIIMPKSKLSLSQMLCGDTATTTLAPELGLGDVSEDELYAAMDWLNHEQESIERRLARKHLQDGSLILYDLSSSYMEGTKCPLAKRGYSRDGKKDRLQIEYGLLCDKDGRPVAVKVFDGNISDSTTLMERVEFVRKRFGIRHLVIVGDRGMVTSRQIDGPLGEMENLSWITALKSSAIRSLIVTEAIQLSFFDTHDMAEIQSPDFPNERLVVCRNEALMHRRAAKREALLVATEKGLADIKDAVDRRRAPLRGADAIGLRVGKMIGRHKMAKHFVLEITDDSFEFTRDQEGIRQESELDGLYVVRSNVPVKEMDASKLVTTYKSLSQVERAFRSMKTVDLKVRPIYHYKEERVRAHVFLCMLAYYVEWHLRLDLAPLLYQDEDKIQAQAERGSAVSKAIRSGSALAKDSQKTNDNGYPVQSFGALLATMATLCSNDVVFRNNPGYTVPMRTRPNALQAEALRLVGARI
jgi:hypothetical protein